MNSDDLIAKLAQLKKEPAPEYVYDECGIGHAARCKMKFYPWLRQKPWFIDLEGDCLPEGM